MYRVQTQPTVPAQLKVKHSATTQLADRDSTCIPVYRRIRASVQAHPGADCIVCKHKTGAPGSQSELEHEDRIRFAVERTPRREPECCGCRGHSSHGTTQGNMNNPGIPQTILWADGANQRSPNPSSPTQIQPVAKRCLGGTWHFRVFCPSSLWPLPLCADTGSEHQEVKPYSLCAKMGTGMRWTVKRMNHTKTRSEV